MYVRMDNGGILLAAGVLCCGAAFVWGHWIGRKAGWCDGYTEGFGDGWNEGLGPDDPEIYVISDHYGESEN